MDTTNLGQFSTTANNNVQNFQGTTGVVFMGAPIYWNSPNHGPVIYIWSGNDFLKAYRLVNGTFQITPVSQSTVSEAAGSSNSVPLSLSANGNQEGTGIVWGSGAFSANANRQTVTGILRAFDAADLTKELWDSKQNTGRDDVGNYAKFSPPTIVNGKVYLATFSNQLLVYGLFADFSVSASPGSATTSAGHSAIYTVTVRPTSSFSNPVSLSCSGLPAGATCSFNPASVTPGTGAATSTLTVTTSTAAENSRPAFDFLERPLSYAIWLPGLVLAGAGWMGSRNRKLARVLLCSVLLGFILMLVRCGGSCSSGTPPNNGTPGTPAGTYTTSWVGLSSSRGTCVPNKTGADEALREGYSGTTVFGLDLSPIMLEQARR